MTTSKNETADTAAVRELVQTWVKAVRAKDFNGILANHSPDILMFDVPPPLALRGIEAYRKTWDLFFAWSDVPVVFEVNDMHITAGNDVAFVAALMRCSGAERSGDKVQLEFRLTLGLRKMGNQWTVIHEHHSIPAP
jgi:uncharacterized protein (TIGR02246 family)